ncbi:MAG: IS701 family transposase [Ktedonobacteraceae bacterium]
MALSQLHQCLAPFFARPEPHRHSLLYLQAILSEIPRKNGWQIAEHARQARPYGIQRLLSRAVWDQNGVRDVVRTQVCQFFHPPPSVPEPAEPVSLFPVLVIDESGFPKRGKHSAGVGHQYCGCSGRVENCQMGVFLSYVTTTGHALIDRELYLPEDWCDDRVRRQAAHIPEHITFQTKPELALQMVHRAQGAHLPINWVVADTVYGHSTDLRLWLQARGIPFALAVPANEVVCIQTSQGYRLGDVASIEGQVLGQQDWQRLSMSQGTKGERLFDWAILPVVHGGMVDGCHWLVIRRCLDDPDEKAFYLVFAPLGSSLQTMVRAIGARWSIEVDLENAKDLGLDQYEVRSYLGWYRHMTLVMLASAFLLGICVQDPDPACQPEEPVSSPALIALTPSEVRHLLARLIWPAPSSAPLICQWSCWRRAHQYWAGYYHRRRRQKAG